MEFQKSRIWKYCYWLDDAMLSLLKKQMEEKAIVMARAKQNPCEALKGDIGYAEPHTWSVICKFDAAPWYHTSRFAGKNLVASSFPLKEQYQQFLETTLELSDFEPECLPSKQQIIELTNDVAYLSSQPELWGSFPNEMGEAIVKGLGEMAGKPPEKFEDLLCTWSAVHANFVSPKYRAGNQFINAPYSIADSMHISSCCVELFNIVSTNEQAMLVRPCIGGVIVGVLERDRYYLVRIIKKGAQ